MRFSKERHTHSLVYLFGNVQTVVSPRFHVIVRFAKQRPIKEVVPFFFGGIGGVDPAIYLDGIVGRRRKYHVVVEFGIIDGESILEP